MRHKIFKVSECGAWGGNTISSSFLIFVKSIWLVFILPRGQRSCFSTTSSTNSWREVVCSNASKVDFLYFTFRQRAQVLSNLIRFKFPVGYHMAFHFLFILTGKLTNTIYCNATIFGSQLQKNRNLVIDSNYCHEILQNVGAGWT